MENENIIEEEPPIQLTENAIATIKKFMAEEKDVDGDGFRVGIRGGGCAGYQYALEFSFQKENDFVFNFDGLKVYLDPISAMHLEGTVIDYISGLYGTGFKFNNPNAKTTCGCGSSFV